MIQNKNYTYNGIINVIESFANAHLDIKRFIAEDEDQMSVLTSQQTAFPLMFIAPTSNVYDYQINQVSMRTYVYDRLLKDRSNITDIRSKTNQILNDFDVWLRKETELPFEISTISNAFTFSSELMTDVTGWYMDITIDIPSYETCKIPFSTAPVISGFTCDITCDITYTNDFLTCGELVDCPTIMQIQGDIIALSGGTGGTGIDTYVIDMAYSDNELTILRNEGQPDLSVVFDSFTGMTINGSLFVQNEDWTIELIDAQTVDFYAPYVMTINSIDTILSATTIALYDDDASYTLGDSIASGSKITVSASTATVINLNTTR